MDIIFEKWNEILERIREEYEISDVPFRTFLQPLTIHSVKDNVITILVPTERVGLDYTKRKYSLPLKVVIEEMTGIACQLEFVVPEDLNPESKKERMATSHSLYGLNPRYTFNTFVVGSNNKFAHAASVAVAEAPGKIYNPLFLYGGVGLGKTHLMHSIAHYILENNPEMNILYVTSEEFTNEVIEAILNGRNGNNTAINKFREKYRSIDVLLVDDVQFIIGKESTQEEFFHTFNSLQMQGKQIILSSDRPPKDMTVLDDRFRSRFEMGLMADIQKPDYETRIAILKKKQEIDGRYVDDEVIEYIAANIKSNIRELEGALNKVIAMSDIEKTPLNLELAQKALVDIISERGKKQVGPEEIIKAVAEMYEVTVEDIKGSKRDSKTVTPRQIAMYLIREMTGATQEAIGQMMGGRHHTTVISALDKVESTKSTSPEMADALETLRNKLTNQ